VVRFNREEAERRREIREHLGEQLKVYYQELTQAAGIDHRLAKLVEQLKKLTEEQ
jgi:hypothetical protein